MSDQTKKGGPRSTKPPLPPPPTLLSPPIPPPPHMSNNNGPSAPSSSSSSGGGGLGVSSSLPPPPALITPRNPSARPPSANNGSTSISTAPLSRPPPMVSSSSLRPPPTLSVAPKNTININTRINTMNDATTTATTTTSSTTPTSTPNMPPTQSIRSSTEKIPPLASAPNSGVSLYDDSDSDDDDSDDEEEDGGASVRARKLALAYGQGAFTSSFPTPRPGESSFAPHPPPPQPTRTCAPRLPPPVRPKRSHAPQPPPAPPAAPDSGSSWSAWAGNLTSTVTTNVANVTPAAGTLLEKAGKLAYSTVESAGELAGDFLIQTGSGSHDRMDNTAGTAARGQGGGGPATSAVDAPGKSPTGAAKDNFANLFGGSKGQTSNGETANSSSAHTDLNDASSSNSMAGMMATPDTSSHAFTPDPPTRQIRSGPPPKPSMMEQQAMMLKQQLQHSQSQQQQQQSQSSSQSSKATIPPPPHQQHQQQTQPRRRRAAANPPLSTLADRQTRLSVLILPTADAQSIAAKNNTTLPEMFRIFGNQTSLQRSQRGGRNTDSSLEPMLPPFRSASRSMALSWENIILNFVSNSDMDNMPVSEGEGERALGEAARPWDEDRADILSVGEEKEDAEMDRLERRVVAALAEDDAEELARREDGVPSMTSAPPSARGSLGATAAAADSDAAEGHGEFPPRPGGALESSAGDAFALSARAASPWLLRFRHTLDCTTDGMYHEMLGCPSVVILAASTSEPSYVNCLAELANVHHLPKPYHDGRYDPNGLRREFLLLHDAVNGPKDFEEGRALQQMRERFGTGCCTVLRINSLVPRPVAISDGYATAGEDAEWENAGPPSPFVANALSPEYASRVPDPARRPIRGACLSPSDKRVLRRYIANMVATGLVPAIERRIAHLNAAVSNAKKGVKNVIKSFWRKPNKVADNLLSVGVGGYSGGGDGGGGGGGGGRRDASTHNTSDASSSGTVRYRFDTIESQTRLLADTLFLMRDYDAALGVYRLVKDDYKHDKAHLHYASVQEMMVLCMHMLDPTGRDGRYSNEVQHSIETALYSYTRVSDEEQQQESDANGGVRPGKAPHATRLATRLCLALSSAPALCERRHVEIADLLASASSHETPLGAAILLEQSSAHYYGAGMLRKYAFHMLMAGHMFRSAGRQDRHAFRCFAASLYVYHGERWGELRSHLRSALAAQLYGMGRYALSMQFYAKLIGMTGGGRVSVRSQQKFLNHIVTVCRDCPMEAIVAVDRMNEGAGKIIDGVAAPKGVEEVLKGLNDGVRQIEISNIGFPHVQDSSVRVFVDSTGSDGAGNSSFVSLGRADSLPIMAADGATPGPVTGKGDESIWQDMTNCAEAELRSAAAVGNNNNNNELASSHDDNGELPSHSTADDESPIDRVIAEIDTEERDAEYRERSKRKGSALRAPEARATHEPLAVTFTMKNPLGLEIELTEMQLVASLACEKMGLVHTNEFSVVSKGEEGSNSSTGKKKSWKFHGSENEFHSPEFACQLPMDSSEEVLSSAFSSSAIDEDSNPYFVVTKSSVTMGPNSDTLVSLKLCPLAEGDLRILGVRFRLLGEVWMYHKFDSKGPLLQDTRVNRSKRVRGESLLLRSKVEQEMPSLKVTITPDGSSTTQSTTVLQGQTSRWKLTLSNLGHAPASNIMLKTNAPWLNMTPPFNYGEKNNKETNHDENAPTSFCIGPSGTLMRVPLDILHPGETVEVPVAIRTSGGGRQEFYMLFRYELWNGKDNTTASSIPRHRWARKLLSVPVYPSITMSASLMPSYSNKGEHILSVELMNYRSDRDSKLEIYLNKICIASRHFEIRQLQGQVDSDDLSQSLISTADDGSSSSSNPVSSSLRIGWQERVTLHYLVVPIEERANNTFVTFSTLLFSSGNQMVSSDVFPRMSRRYGAQVTDFMCRERAHEVFSSTLHSHRIEKEQMASEQEKKGQPRHVAQIRRDRTSLPEQESNAWSASDGQSQVSKSAPLVAAHPTSLASLCPLSGGSNINIICCWSAVVGNEGRDITIQGQHHLRDLLVRPLNKSKGCPLALTAKYKPKVSHDFDEGPLDEDVEITIRNRLIETKVEFEFAIDHTEFDFVGTTCFNWSLSGGDEISVPLKARIYSGGVYNLQSVRLTVLKAGTAVPYLFPLQWTMMVEDSA